jgi:hypothetical protein
MGARTAPALRSLLDSSTYHPFHQPSVTMASYMRSSWILRRGMILIGLAMAVQMVGFRVYWKWLVFRNGFMRRAHAAIP